MVERQEELDEELDWLDNGLKPKLKITIGLRPDFPVWISLWNSFLLTSNNRLN